MVFSLMLTSVTWLYPATDATANAQTLRTGSAIVSRTSECRLYVDKNVKRWAQFQQLRSEWKVKRGAISSITGMSMLEPYQKIIGMGDDALPLILAQLRSEGDEPDQWFWALKMITGVDPVQPTDQGNFRAMAQAWLAWGESEGYAGYLAA